MIYRSLVSKINKLKFLQSPIKAHHLPPWWLYKHPVVWFARVPMISVSLTWEQVFFSSLVFPHPYGHSERVHADIPGKATSGRVSRDQKLWGKKIKVVKLLTGIFFHWLLNTCNWKTLCFRSCMVAIRLLLFHKMSSSQRLGYNFLIEIKPSGI